MTTESDGRVAVYGSLRQGRRWHHLLAESPCLGAGWTVHPYALYLADYPCADQETPISPLRVEVYQVSSEVLAILDELEEHPFVYVRKQVPIWLDTDQELEAWVYFFPYPQGQLLASGDYLQVGQMHDMRPTSECKAAIL